MEIYWAQRSARRPARQTPKNENPAYRRTEARRSAGPRVTWKNYVFVSNTLNSDGWRAVIRTMNPKLLLPVPVWIRNSRCEWLAVARCAGLGAVLVSLSSCVVAGGRHRPAVVVAAPAPAVVIVEPPRVVEKVVVIREAPPAPRREVIVEGDRPSAAHMWVAGHWRHDGRVYTWIPGHWAKPPRARAVWVEPRWEKRDGIYIFIEGIWR